MCRGFWPASVVEHPRVTDAIDIFTKKEKKKLKGVVENGLYYRKDFFLGKQCIDIFTSSLLSLEFTQKLDVFNFFA